MSKVNNLRYPPAHSWRRNLFLPINTHTHTCPNIHADIHIQAHRHTHRHSYTAVTDASEKLNIFLTLYLKINARWYTPVHTDANTPTCIHRCTQTRMWTHTYTHRYAYPCALTISVSPAAHTLPVPPSPRLLLWGKGPIKGSQLPDSPPGLSFLCGASLPSLHPDGRGPCGEAGAGGGERSLRPSQATLGG